MNYPRAETALKCLATFSPEERKYFEDSYLSNKYFENGYLSNMDKRIEMKMSSLGCCKKAPTPQCVPQYNTGPLGYQEEVTGCKSNQEKENNMNTSIQVAVNDDNTKRYLKDRLYAVTANKRDALRVKFGMADADSPRTLEDFFQRIKDGKYVVAKDDMKRRSYEPAMYIMWRDPATVRDEDGFEAANAKLKAAETATKDAIVVLDNEKGLAALQAFEATEIA